MPARKMPPITLARTAGPEQHDAHCLTRHEHFGAIDRRIQAARRGIPLVAEAMMARRITAETALEQFSRGVSGLGHRVPDTPTVERLMQAKGEASVNFGLDSVVVYDEHNEPRVERHPVIRTRMTDSPVEILAKRRLLSRDPEQNAAYLKACRQLLQDWTDAGLSAIGSIDFEKDVRKGTPPTLFRSEAQVDAFMAYHGAMRCLTPDERSIVHAIVIDETPVPMVGHKMLAIRSAKPAQAAALWLFRQALYRLALAYGFLQPAYVDPPVLEPA